MIIRCNQALLGEAVAIVSRAVPPKSSIPALEGIYMKAAGKTISLTGYNLDIGISTSLEGEVETEGEIVLNAKLLLDIVRRLPGETVEISVDERHLANILSGEAEYTILGMAAEEFPQLPDVSSTENITLPQPVLKSIINQTSFAISLSEDKPVHTGALFVMEDQTLTVVAVDGFRLALRKERLNFANDLKFVVPRATLIEVSRILKDDEDEQVLLMVSRKHIIFNIGNYLVVSRLLEGEFLDYKSAIPKNASTTAVVGTRDMIESIERTSLLISDRLRSPLKVRIAEQKIKISCTTALGKANDSFAAQLSGEGVEMGFNHRYLLDALRACDGDRTKLEIAGALSPMKVLPLEGDSYLFLVLPVRLKNE